MSSTVPSAALPALTRPRATLPAFVATAGQILRHWLSFVAPPVLTLALLIAIWAVLAELGVIPAYLLPTPKALLHELLTNTALLAKRGAYTAQEAWTGLIIGNIAAVTAAVLVAWLEPVRRCLYPLALVSRAVPMIALVPLLVIAFGYGMTPIITIVAIHAFFPTLLNMVRGLRSADVQYHELLHTLSATRLQRLWLVDLPASTPFLFAALKVGASACFIGAVTGEWAGANAGLGGIGYMIEMSSYHFRLDTLWSGVVVAALLTLVTLGLVVLLERVVMRWQPRNQNDAA